MTDIRHTHGLVEALTGLTPDLWATQTCIEALMNDLTAATAAVWATQAAMEVLLTVPVLAGELDRRTLTTATGALNATWTPTASGNWTAGLVALKKT